MMFLRYEKNILCGLTVDGGEGAATAPAGADEKTALDRTIEGMAQSSLKDFRSEKYAVGSNFRIESRGRGGEYFDVTDAGVVSFRPVGRDKETGEQKYDSVRVCGRLDVLGKSCNADGESWGRVICFKDGNGIEHRVTLSMEDILSGGAGLSQKLGGKGLSVTDVSSANTLASVNRYILSFDESDLKTIKTISIGGWSDESFSCFVLGDNAVRTSAGDCAELSAGAVGAPAKSRGTLAEWQKWMSGIAPYSERMSFAVMVALAAPLLPIVGDMSRLFHFYGGSSTGKTTAVKVAATVWGGLDWVRSWNTTRNAPAALAKQFNCLPLVFDELKAARGVVKDVSYILSSVSDRARCGKDGNASKAGESWNIYVLSTGEGSLQEIKQQSCRGVDADTATGELVRFIDIPAVANPENPENGIFESLPDGVETAEDRRRWIDGYCSAPSAYGTAGRAFLEALERDIEESGLEAFRKNVNAWMDKFSEGLSVTSATVSRVVKAFAIVAAAGELARGYGVLPWNEGDAARIAKTCLQAWRTSANALEDREGNFVDSVLDDTKRREAAYTCYNANGLNRTPSATSPSLGALLIRDNDGAPETMLAAYSAGEFTELLNRTGGGVMNGEAMAFLKNQGRLVSNRKGANDAHAGDFRTPRRKGVLPMGLRNDKFYKFVLVSDDKAAVLQLLESLKLNPPAEI